MPTTSSPWASPSSPAGRRLLQTEPATADDIPVLDEATLALGAVLVAASSSPVLGAPAVRPVPVRRTSVARRALVAAALVVGLLVAAAGAGLDDPAPAAPAAAPASFAFARVAGAAMAADASLPAAKAVPDGQVVVALLEPTEAVGAAPMAATPPLAERLGLLVALAAEDG